MCLTIGGGLSFLQLLIIKKDFVHCFMFTLFKQILINYPRMMPYTAFLYSVTFLFRNKKAGFLSHLDYVTILFSFFG